MPLVELTPPHKAPALLVGGGTIEVFPGQRFTPLQPEDIAPERVALAELVPAGDGTWRLVARICPRHFAVNRRTLKRLGIPLSETTFRRLILAGFVVGAQVTPGVMQFDFPSYLAHVERVRLDSEFWDQVEVGHRFTNRERYRQTI